MTSTELGILVVILTELTSIILCMHIFFRQKLYIDWKLISLLLVDTAIMYVVRIGGCSRCCLLICYMLVWVYCKKQFHKSIKITTLKYLSSFALCGALEAVLLLPNIWLQQYINVYTLHLADSAIMLCSILGLAAVFSKKITVTDYKADRTAGRMIWIFVVVQILLIVDYNIKKAPLRLSTLLLSICILIGYVSISRMVRMKTDLKIKIMESEMSQIYDECYAQLLSEIRCRQHDYKNQIEAILGMQQSAKSLEELIQMQCEYKVGLDHNSKFDSILTKCSNPTIAGFLYNRFMQCENMDVTITYDVYLNDISEVISTYDMITILGILIDNACEYVSNHDVKRKIHMYLKGDSQNVILEVLNPSQYICANQIEEMFLEGKSSKGKNRGIGLFHLKKLSQYYNADLFVENRQMQENEIIEKEKNEKEKRKTENWICFQMNIKRKNRQKR